MLTVFLNKEIQHKTRGNWVKAIDWHVGERLPPTISYDMVDAIQADCDELEHIVDVFSVARRVRTHGVSPEEQPIIKIPTIPVSDKRVQNWVGDIARTIFLALR